VKHIRLFGLLVVLVAMAAGCGGRSGGTPGGDGPGVPGVAPTDDLRGRTFLSTSVTEGGKPRELAAGTQISLQFTDDGRLLANAGCNSMSGQVSLADGRLTAADLATTDMGCDPPRHQQDGWLAAFLSAGPAWRLDDQNLVLTSGDTELVLVDRKVAQPDLALRETQWTVDTVVDGDIASSTIAGVSASVVFLADRVEVDAGCNSGSGTYQATDTKITFGPLAMTRKACEPGVMQFEQSVLAVLDGEVGYEIDSDRLTLDHPSGKGLQLRG
jgi:heat shock protein HslJ